MELSPYVEGLRRELGSLTRFASDDVVRLAERLAEAPGPAADSAADEAGTARVTLRLSEALKTRVEAQAAADGLSVNSWLAHAAIRALENAGPVRGPRSRSGVGQRIT